MMFHHRKNKTKCFKCSNQILKSNNLKVILAFIISNYEFTSVFVTRLETLGVVLNEFIKF
jgi:hypothetical protein